MIQLKKILLLATLLFSCLSFSQLGNGIYFGNNRYEKAEILLENGQSRIGYIRDFTNYRNYTDSYSQFKSIEKRLGFETDKFYFRGNENDEDEEITIENMKSIIILEKESNESVMRLDKLRLKTINSFYKVVDLKKTVMMPLQSEGKLKIYGFSYSRGSAQAAMSIFVPYFKERESDYAYLPFDVNRINIFNFWKLQKKMTRAFQESTIHCPKFQAYLKKSGSEFQPTRKEMMKRYKERKKKQKKIIKEIDNDEMKIMLLRKLDTEYNLKPYMKIQEKYNEICD